MSKTLDREEMRSMPTAGMTDEGYRRTDSGGRGRRPKMKARPFFQALYCRFQEDDVPALGAQLTYYLILAFFPFLIFVIAVLNYADITADEAIASLSRILPETSNKTITDVIQDIRGSSSGSLLSIGIFTALWSASSGIDAVIKALNKAYDVEEERPYWKAKGISVIFTIIMAVVILLSFVLLVFGRVIGESLYKFSRLPGNFEWIWGVVQYAVPLVSLMALFVLLYKFTPNLRLTFREVLPGTLFATFGWIVTSVLFSFYVNNFNNYSKTYGSIGGIIVLLIWLYLSSMIAVLGGEINATLRFDREGKQRSACKQFSLPLPFGNKKSGGRQRPAADRVTQDGMKT